jgi:hypothetical protein
MAKTTPAAPAPAADSGQDWPARATETIVEQIQRIRDKTTGPALTAAHWAVYAAFAISLGTVALVIFVIGAVRLLDVYLPDAVFGDTHMWAAHTIMGSLLLLAGLILYRVKVSPARRN